MNLLIQQKKEKEKKQNTEREINIEYVYILQQIKIYMDTEF